MGWTTLAAADLSANGVNFISVRAPSEGVQYSPHGLKAFEWVKGIARNNLIPRLTVLALGQGAIKIHASEGLSSISSLVTIQ